MKLKIGYKEYEVIPVPRIIETGGELYGRIDYTETIITLATSFPDNQINQTFLHELIHAIADIKDLRAVNDDEHTVQLLSAGLYEAMKDNPHIFTMSGIPAKLHEEEKHDKGTIDRNGADG